jgi:hypothetical protein
MNSSKDVTGIRPADFYRKSPMVIGADVHLQGT